MLKYNKNIGMSSPTHGMVDGMAGVPATVPGGNDGNDKTKMTGTPMARPLADEAEKGGGASTAGVKRVFDRADAGGGGDSLERYFKPGGSVVDAAGRLGTPMKKYDGSELDDDYDKRVIEQAAERKRAAEQAAEHEAQMRADAVKGVDRQIRTTQDWLDAEEHKPETEEQRKQREKRERSKKIIAAVSDGLSALSNLYYTSQYAPNMYNHEKGSQLTPLKARIEKMKAERDKQKDAYMNMSLKLGDLENGRAATLRELEAELERRKLAREKAQREADLHPLIKRIKQYQGLKEMGLADKAGHEADKAGYEAETAQTEAEYAPQIAKGKVALNNAKVATEGARQGAYRASAYNSLQHGNKARIEAGQALNGPVYYDKNGYPHRAKNASDAKSMAIINGTGDEDGPFMPTFAKLNPDGSEIWTVVNAGRGVGALGKGNGNGKKGTGKKSPTR